MCIPLHLAGHLEAMNTIDDGETVGPDVLMILDEHYNNVKVLDALNQELF